MKILTLLISSALLLCQSAHAGDLSASPTNAPVRLALRDQFDAPQRLSFPTTSPTLLTIADKKGSEQIAGWVAPVKQRFPTQVDIRGIADVSSVPGPFRGLVRKQMRKSQQFPIMMDWSGEARKAFSSVPGKANVLVLDRRGRILQRFTGAATAQALQDLCALIDQALKAQPLHSATQ